MAKYACPKGHTRGIVESVTLHAWLPVSLETGEVDGEAELGGDLDWIDWESRKSDCYYWCDDCGDTFDRLQVIETAAEVES